MSTPSRSTADPYLIAEFETTCQSYDLPIPLLPPHCPQYNGCGTRAHQTTRWLLLNFCDGWLNVVVINRALQERLHFCPRRCSQSFLRPVEAARLSCEASIRYLNVSHVSGPARVHLSCALLCIRIDGLSGTYTH